ncbi:MAG TPA: hypothetical protein VFG79_20025 [Solirubrobacter sp.]|nr:hypothetical protein [Solirubrobacter sp.]
MTIRVLLAALAATASLAACGSEAPTTAGDREAAQRKALLDYARCMREHGIDMPDPKFDGNRVEMRGPKTRIDEDKMREAEEACEKFRESVKPPELSEQEKEEMRTAALAHARCMREQGIDFPDPTFDENGGALVRIGRDSGIDPESQKFRDAQEACRDKLPQRPGGDQ